MLTSRGHGVATYARALRLAQRAIDSRSALLMDRANPVSRAPRSGRAVRWLGALLPLSRSARRTTDAQGADVFVGRDLFRLAQVWFDVHRRLLPVQVPGPRGVMHWSYPLPLRLVGWHNIYTIHDVIPLTAPGLSPVPSRRHARLLRRILREAAASGAIATVSAAARTEIVAALGCPPDLVVDCGQAVTAAASAVPLPQGLRPNGYLLVCGSIEPRKNVARLLAAYRASGVTLPLVFAGRDGWQAEVLGPRIAATPGTIRLAEVDDPTMTTLLAHARALVLPSLAEGFGLPVVEAMALGTPVLTSRDGALAETAGGAALLVDPIDEADLAAGFHRIATDEALRRALSAAGLANARRYTPERFAERLSALYGRVAARAVSTPPGSEESRGGCA